MGITKTEYFTEEQNELAMAKQLATLLIAIIQHLIKSEQLCVRRYRKQLPLTTYHYPTCQRIKTWGYQR
jgi:hypothetical protein